MRLLITCLLTFFTLYAAGQSVDKYDIITDSLTKKGEPEKLIAYFVKELKANPKNENVLRRLGYLYIKENQPELGKKYYQQALALNPKCVRCILNIALLYEKTDDPEKALIYFNKAIAIDPENPVSYSNRAHLKEATGDNSGALSDYDKAVALDFENAGYYVQRGNYHFKQGSFILALADMNRSVQLAPKNYFPYYQRAIIYYNSRKISEALADVNMALQLDSTQQVLYTFRGAVYNAVEEHEKAIADYTKAIQLDPKDYYPYYNRAQSKHAMEDMDGSCTDMQACYELIKKYAPGDSLKTQLEKSISNYCDPSKPGYFYQRGIAFYNVQQFQKAVDIYTTGISKFPDNSMLLSFRGNARFALKDYANAIPDYYASIQHKANVAKEAVLNNVPVEAYVKGFLASMQISIAEAKFALGQYDEALTEINKGISIAPESTELPKELYYNTRGCILLALGKYQEAKNDFDTCIKLNVSFSPAYINRAVAKINLPNKVRIATSSFRGNIDNHSFRVNWVLPLKSSLKNSDEVLFSALADCSKAIDIDPALDFAYYLRGRIKNMLNSGGQCYDLIKAKDLGYPVEQALLGGCRQ